MNPDELTKRLTIKLSELRLNIESVHKKIQHEIILLRAEIGPDNWDASYRIATYLALKNVMDNVEREDENDFEFE